MKRSVLTVMLLVFAFGLVGTAKPASAQLNYQFGYQFLHFTGNEGDDGVNLPFGFDVNAGFPLKPMGPLHIVGDVSWGRGSFNDQGFDVSVAALTFGGGVRFMPPTMPRLGIQALAGIQRVSQSIDNCDAAGCSFSDSDLFIQPGVEFMVPVNDRWNMFVGATSGS